MSAPRYAPINPVAQPRTYRSPDHVPTSWTAGRRGEIDGGQPAGPRLGVQGPDQGYVLRLVRLAEPRIVLQPHEHLEDASAGIAAIALRRASHYGRAPVMHDVDFAIEIWGWNLAQPPADLLARRHEMWEGAGHDYAMVRELAVRVGDVGLGMPAAKVAESMPAAWMALTGC